MKDKRVREAMNLAIDRAEIAQSIFAGQAEPAAIPMGLSWSFRDIGFKVTPDMVYPYDPARAKKLLADAGVASGFPLDVYAYQLPGLPEGKAFAEAVAGYWEKIGIKTKLIPVDYPAFRKQWVDRKIPGSVGYYNIANRDWIGTYALLEKMAYTPSKLNDTVNDAEIDGMIAQVMRQTDQDKINALMRNIYTRMRSEHYGVPVVYLHSPYATSQDARQVEPGLGDVRPVHRRAGLEEVADRVDPLRPVAAAPVAGGPGHPVRRRLRPGPGHRRSAPPHPAHVGHRGGLRQRPPVPRPRPALCRAVPVVRGPGGHRRLRHVAPRAQAGERADRASGCPTRSGSPSSPWASRSPSRSRSASWPR